MMRMAQVRAICVGVLLLTSASASSAHAGEVLTVSDVLAIKVIDQAGSGYDRARGARLHDQLSLCGPDQGRGAH